jgi:hypothetical protein
MLTDDMSAQIQTLRLSVEHQPQILTVRSLLNETEKTSVMDKKILNLENCLWHRLGGGVCFSLSNLSDIFSLLKREALF